MINTQEIPTAGYHLEKVYTNLQRFEGKQVSKEAQLDDEPQVGIGWDWRIREQGAFEVILSLELLPSKQRHEEVEVVLIGLFRLTGRPLAVEVEKFAAKHAPAILLPYAREAISSMTGRGVNGAFYLPPVNLVEMMKEMDFGTSTGSRQLKEDPSASKALGLKDV